MSPDLPAKDSLRRYTLILLAFALTVYTLQQLSTILQPIFLAAYLCYFAVPMRNRLVKWRISPLLANALVPIVLILFLVLFGWLIALNVETLASRFPIYREQIDGIWISLLDFLRGLHPTMRQKVDSLFEMGAAVIPFDKVGGWLGTWVGSLFHFIGVALVVGFYMIFLLLEAKDFPKRLRLAFGERRGESLLELFTKISNGILVYNQVKMTISFWVALLTTMVLLVFRVDSWLFWGILTYFANFIPYIGPIAITVPPVLLFYLQSGSLILTLALGGGLVSIHMVIGHYLEPRVTGASLNLSPLLVVIGLAFWGWLWGVPGMLLAVPALVALRLGFESNPKTKGIAELLGSRA